MTKKKNIKERHIYVFLNPYTDSGPGKILQSNRNFFKFFLFLVDHFGLSGSRAGSSEPFESGSNPDPKHCKKVVLTTCS
jgi:hypothetical protein